MNKVNLKERIIPAHTITRCFDCPYFKEYGAAYTDGNTCEHENYTSHKTVPGDEIPDECPIREQP
jgi:hypothetical protein